jgi:hypothetical protein
VSNVKIWNNVVLGGGRPILAYGDSEVPFAPRGPRAPLAYMDYNVYDGSPAYEFGADVARPSAFDFSQMRSHGFEWHGRVIRGGRALFEDSAPLRLRARWQTAGRDGDPVGPRFPIDRIRDPRRYGPGALDAGAGPHISRQP